VVSSVLATTSDCDNQLDCLGVAVLWVGTNVVGAIYSFFANLGSGSNKAKAKKDLLLHFNNLSPKEDLKDIGMAPNPDMFSSPSLNLILGSMV